MKNKFSKMFGGKEAESLNALYTALHNAADANYEESGKVYDYIEGCPRTSLVCELNYQLEELGFEIRRKKD